jgi:hypothetical protein
MFDRAAVLQQHAGDMLALEQHIMEALEAQAEMEVVRVHPRTRDLLARAAAVTRTHYATLDQYCVTVGAEPASLLQRAAAAISATLSGLYARSHGQPVSRLLRDDYTALSLAAVSYTVLHTVGLALHDQRLAGLSVEHLQDLTPVIGEIGSAIPELVALELTEAEQAAAPAPEAAAVAGPAAP